MVIELNVLLHVFFLFYVLRECVFASVDCI